MPLVASNRVVCAEFRQREARKGRQAVVDCRRQCAGERGPGGIIRKRDRHRAVIVRGRVARAVLNRDDKAKCVAGSDAAGRLGQYGELRGVTDVRQCHNADHVGRTGYARGAKPDVAVRA